MALILNNLSHIYNQGRALEGRALEEINLVIEEGEFLGICGATGSGKSTLVQHFNGLLKPTSGQVLYKGRDIWADGNVNDMRSKVGLVFQYPEQQLFAETVGEDVAFGPGNLGLAEELIIQRVTRALEQVGLKPDLYLQRNPLALSGGEKRRVALAGVLAMEPDVLVLDEPTAGLDARGREALLQILEDFHRQGTTIIMVSHNMNDLARLAQRLVVLSKGRLILQGTPGEVFSQPETLREAGLEVPLITELMTKLQRLGAGVDTAVTTPEAALAELIRLLGGGHHD